MTVAQTEHFGPQVPPPGQVEEVAPGIFWARLPLPFRLDHVNVWLLDEAEGWVVVDSGCSTPLAREAWERLFDGFLHGRRVSRFIATHGHIDHVGLAGPIAARSDAPVMITRTEWLNAHFRRHEADVAAPPAFSNFLRKHGCNEDVVRQAIAHRSSVANYVSGFPMEYERLVGGGTVRFGGRNWRIVVAGGHASEHACFYCEDDGIMLAGDQILKQITPVVSVLYNEPDGNPLSEYLDSLDMLAEFPDETLVLPGHGLPFHGLRERAGEIRRHHERRLDLFADAASAPSTAFELANVTFSRAIEEGQGRLALAETLAHLNLLVARGRLERRLAADGTIRLVRPASSGRANRAETIS